MNGVQPDVDQIDGALFMLLRLAIEEGCLTMERFDWAVHHVGRKKLRFYCLPVSDKMPWIPPFGMPDWPDWKPVYGLVLKQGNEPAVAAPTIVELLDRAMQDRRFYVLTGSGDSP